MKEQTRYLIFAAVVLFAVTWTVSMNYGRIRYAGDYILSLSAGITQSILPSKGVFIIVRPEKLLSYEKPFSALSDEMFHSGPFLFYKPKNEIKVRDAAALLIKYTDIFTVQEMDTLLRKINGINGNTISEGKIILIPEKLPALIEDARNHKKPDIVFTKGIYLSGSSAGSRRFFEKIPNLESLGINCVVFDIKDVGGIVNHNSSIADVKRYNTDKNMTIGNVKKLIRELKKNKIYSIARISVFHDQLLAKTDKSLAIKSKRTGGTWTPGGREIWCDPTNKKVQDYNIKLAVELAELGVNEIQFDYIRFPTTGDFSDAVFAYDFGKVSREETIANFLKRARKEISLKNTNLSIDIFGVVAWGKEVDIKSTGQRISLLAEHCDVISPMLYPSHFNDDFDGRANPGDHPYYFIKEGCSKVLSMSGGKVKVRPWLQAFTLRVSNYNAKYIRDQIKGSDDSNAFGYLFWNASNNYDVVYKALEK